MARAINQSEVLLLGVVPREVRGESAWRPHEKESSRLGGGIELFGFASIGECGIMGLRARWRASLGSMAGGFGVVEVDFALSNARFDIVELRVKDADLAKVTALEGLQLSAELGKLSFTLGKQRANGSQSLALVEKVDVVRGLLEDDFSWHTASRQGNF